MSQLQCSRGSVEQLACYLVVHVRKNLHLGKFDSTVRILGRACMRHSHFHICGYIQSYEFAHTLTKKNTTIKRTSRLTRFAPDASRFHLLLLSKAHALIVKVKNNSKHLEEAGAKNPRVGSMDTCNAKLALIAIYTCNHRTFAHRYFLSGNF